MNKIYGRKTLFSSLKISIFGVTFVDFIHGRRLLSSKPNVLSLRSKASEKLDTHV